MVDKLSKSERVKFSIFCDLQMKVFLQDVRNLEKKKKNNTELVFEKPYSEEFIYHLLYKLYRKYNEE